MAEKKAYSEAASSGQYDKPTGLFGKYDNVRRFWEDQVTAIFLGPIIEELMERKRKEKEKLRILDLGCGSGEGYDLLINIRKTKPNLSEILANIISTELLDSYTGVDINEDLLQQAEECYRDDPRLQFLCEDISTGLPSSIKEKEPFDIYFTSYGTLSHFDDEQNVKLLTDIFKHASAGAIVIGDWLGSYSYEWQDLWQKPTDQEQFMDYRISYIYPEEERDQHEISSFPLKLMTSNKISQIIKQASQESSVEIEAHKYFDRSILVGRHTETRDYNRNCIPYRSFVNSLYEVNERTDLKSLQLKYTPRAGFEDVNRFFDVFFTYCSILVQCTLEMIQTYDSNKWIIEDNLLKQKPILNPVKNAVLFMRRLIYQNESIENDDFRANIIEPFLAYLLRKLEIDLQPGTGVGHGLVGVFKIKK